MSGPDGSDAGRADGPSTTPAVPFVTVVRGRPTEEELAALVVALAAASGPEPATPPPPVRSGWGSYADAIRPSLQPGPGAWVASARPR